jgi:predicted nucleotide-binding protein
MNINQFLKELDEAQKALNRLDGALTTVHFDPDEPGSIQAAIHQMEAAVDRCVSAYSRNPFVKELTDGVKANLAEQIMEKASQARSEKIDGENNGMDNTIFRQIENAVNDLKWSDMNTFGRHIKKLSKLLNSDDLKPICNELLELVDLEAWIEAGQATQGGMVGSAELDWPTNPREEMGITIALAHWFADDPERAWNFAHTFYYSGGKVTPELQGMVAQVFAPFGRDFIDYVKDQTGAQELTSIPERKPSSARKVFVVHGHDEAAKEGMARFLERIGFEAVILHEQASGNRTVIEKIEAHSDVGFAVVLLTPDDIGGAANAESQPRARQNVILELGYFVGLLGRSRVAVFRKGEVEVPSDFGGVVYVDLDGGGAWKQTLGKELEEAGFQIDWNQIMR